MHTKFWIRKIIGFIILAIVATTLLGYIVMSLWNNILVAVLNVTVISFWQALGILVLSKILFGGFHCGSGWGRRHSAGWGKELHEKWHTMTPEEKEKIKQEWRNRCRMWRNPANGADGGQNT